MFIMPFPVKLGVQLVSRNWLCRRPNYFWKYRTADLHGSWLQIILVQILIKKIDLTKKLDLALCTWTERSFHIFFLELKFLDFNWSQLYFLFVAEKWDEIRNCKINLYLLFSNYISLFCVSWIWWRHLLTFKVNLKRFSTPTKEIMNEDILVTYWSSRIHVFIWEWGADSIGPHPIDPPTVLPQCCYYVRECPSLSLVPIQFPDYSQKWQFFQRISLF